MGLTYVRLMILLPELSFDARELSLSYCRSCQSNRMALMLGQCWAIVGPPCWADRRQPLACNGRCLGHIGPHVGSIADPFCFGILGHTEHLCVAYGEPDWLDEDGPTCSWRARPIFLDCQRVAGAGLRSSLWRPLCCTGTSMVAIGSGMDGPADCSSE
jgi:hypothetical protein